MWYKDIDESSGTINSVQFTINDSSPDSSGGYSTYDVDGVVGNLSNITSGSTAVRISGGSLLLDASSQYAPYLDVIGDTTAETGSTVVRTGNLAGIGSANFGTLSGYGFWASGSAYLEGSINATSGKIGTWGISDTAITSSGDNMKIDAYMKRITVNDGSQDRVWFGEVDGTSSPGSTYGLKIFNSSGPGDSNRLVELGEGDNMIAGWNLGTDAISKSNISLNATIPSLRVSDGSTERVRVGDLNGIGGYTSAKYGVIERPPSIRNVQRSFCLWYTSRIRPVRFEKKNSICLGKCLDTPTPNRASIVCFSFKTGSTQTLA